MSVENHRVGAIDCGTNSIRLLIADRVDGRLVDLHREMRIVRLGQGVDATGRFAPDAPARTEAALIDYAELLGSFGVGRVRMVATSATRDAANREVFFAMTAEVLGGVCPGAVAEVITGAQEAELSFNGAVGELDPEQHLSWSSISVADRPRWSSVTGTVCRPASPPTSAVSG